eukprot:g431.t1
MGACNSKQEESASVEDSGNVSHVDGDPMEDDHFESVEPLTKSQIEARKISGTGTIKFASGLTMNYSYLTQRGYYPDQPDKANQDNYNVCEKFCGVENRAFFGVFDGHGKDGDLASYYARDKLPKTLEKWTKTLDLKRAHKKAFVDVNDKMCSNSVFDTMMSGTTAITACLDDNNLLVANCGDSRCVVACSGPDGKLVAQPLSRDQTPHRRDELRRVKRAGAMVCNMAQLEGAEPMHENWSLTLGDVIDDGGDPPRLFLRGKVYPGVAFTRSIGDALAQGIGVYAEPEMMELKLNAQHKYLILASDGIWEFITNQEAVDILEKNKQTPLRACHALVQKAYQLWLQYEVRTDDITVIVVKLDGLASMTEEEEMKARRKTGVSATTRKIISTQRDAKRRKTRKKIATNKAFENIGSYYPEEHKVPKGEAERSRIRAAVKDNFLFSKLNAEQLELTIDVMMRQTAENGKLLIREGEEGDKFYIAEKGTFDVFVQDKKVHEYVAKEGLFPSFGELALLHGAPRKATIKATSDGSLWVLERLAFQTMLMMSPEQALMKQLKNIKVFKTVPMSTLSRLSEVMEKRYFKDGEAICKQGQPAHHFYVLKSGRCSIERDGRQLHVGQRYFGERALLTSDPRKATVIARGDTTCWVISRATFEEKFGKMQTFIDIYNHQKKHNEELEKLVSDYTENFGNGLTAFGATKEDRKQFVDFCMDTDKSPCEEKYVVSTDSIDGKLTVVTLRDKIFSVKSICCLGKAAENHVKNQAKLALELSHNCKVFAEIRAQRKQEVAIDDTSKDIWVHTLMSGEICSSLHELFHDNHPVFTEDEAKYVMASMVLAVHQAHLHNIIYRSVAPEFISLDKDGVIKLHHLELSKQTKFMELTRTRCGVPEFMSPEQVLGSGHGPAVDLWAMGILAFDILCGCTPFAPEHESGLMLIYESILAHDENDDLEPPPKVSISKDALDFITRLLHPKPAKRLGSKLRHKDEEQTLKSHPFFNGFDWQSLEDGTMRSPLKDILEKAPKQDDVVGDEDFEI